MRKGTLEAKKPNPGTLANVTKQCRAATSGSPKATAHPSQHAQVHEQEIRPPKLKPADPGKSKCCSSVHAADKGTCIPESRRGHEEQTPLPSAPWGRWRTRQTSTQRLHLACHEPKYPRVWLQLLQLGQQSLKRGVATPVTTSVGA